MSNCRKKCAYSQIWTIRSECRRRFIFKNFIFKNMLVIQFFNIFIFIFYFLILFKVYFFLGFLLFPSPPRNWPCGASYVLPLATREGYITWKTQYSEAVIFGQSMSWLGLQMQAQARSRAAPVKWWGPVTGQPFTGFGPFPASSLRASRPKSQPFSVVRVLHFVSLQFSLSGSLSISAPLCCRFSGRRTKDAGHLEAIRTQLPCSHLAQIHLPSGESV